MIEANIFGSPILRGLKGAYKTLYLYLYTECDHAGIYNVELDIASVRCGFEYDPDICLQALGNRVVPVHGGEMWFIPHFLHAQYKKRGDGHSQDIPPEMNPRDRVHESVIKRLKEFDLLEYISIKNHQGAGEGHPSPLNGAIYKVKDKEKDKEIKGVEGLGDEGEENSKFKNQNSKGSYEGENHNSQTPNYPFYSEYTEYPVEQCLEYYRTSGYEMARNTLAQLWKITPEQVLCWAEIFTTTLKTRSQPDKTMADYAQHFASWLKLKADKTNPEKFIEHATSNGKNANAGNTGRQGSDIADLLKLRHNAQPSAGAEKPTEQHTPARPVG